MAYCKYCKKRVHPAEHKDCAGASMQHVSKALGRPTRFMSCTATQVKGKDLQQQAQGFPVRLRPRIFLTFGTTRVVGRQPYAPAAFTPEEIPGTHF